MNPDFHYSRHDAMRAIVVLGFIAAAAVAMLDACEVDRGRRR